MKSIIEDLEGLNAIIDDDAKVTKVYDPWNVEVTWPDGSNCCLYHRHGEWHFRDDNRAYLSGCDYAAGYHE